MSLAVTMLSSALPPIPLTEWMRTFSLKISPGQGSNPGPQDRSATQPRPSEEELELHASIATNRTRASITISNRVTTKPQCSLASVI